MRAIWLAIKPVSDYILFYWSYRFSQLIKFLTNASALLNLAAVLAAIALITTARFLSTEIFFDLVTYRTVLDVILLAISIDVFYYMLLTALTAYLFLGIVLFFYWGYIGLRGVFYLAEFTLCTLFCLVALDIYLNLKYHLVITCCLGELFISEDFALCCTVHLDLLAMLGVLLVVALTAIALTFGTEYMSREAFAYNVIIILCAFSASIVWFIMSYDLGLMTIFWEFSGLFSLLLVDTFYNRIRTTQAVSRTFAISRFSDYWIFIALVEMAAAFQTESLATLFSIIKVASAETAALAIYPVDCTTLSVIVACLFVAASCKCAQFILFVWLPDAMEAPTPASALIHSSTLVVMGIFMMLRLSPVLRLSTGILYTVLVAGALTILYGAVFSVQTGDLKKAVAYSTISQVGYLYCGCGLLALRETLIYLVVHAVCKAMLFIFVGYLVHLFGGTTSLRKMGGIFYLVPDIAVFMFSLCLVLAGAPYTIGFIAKELIVNHLLSVYSPIMCFVIFCWVVAFLCTPLYLYRICVLPIFGRPRASRRVYRNILMLKSKSRHFAINSFDLNRLNNPLFFFIYHTRDLYISSRFTAVLHTLIMLFITYCGEFFILLVSGFFATSDSLFGASSLDLSTFAVTSYYVNSYDLVKGMQLLILSLFAAVTVYIAVINIRDSRNSYTAAIFIGACLFAIELYTLYINY